MKSRRQTMVFMPLVLVWIGQFCCDVIGRKDVKVVVSDLVGCCFAVIFDPSIVCLSLSYEVMYESTHTSCQTNIK